MVAWEKKKTGDLLLLFNGIFLAVVINQLAAFYFFRFDLTDEKRYTIKAPTIALLQDLDDDVYVDVYLEGDLNAEFRRLRKAVRETLEEFRVRSGNRVHYQFSDPLAAAGANARQEFMSDLVSKGLKPLNIIDSKDGRRSEKIVFPGALVSFGGLQTGVMLLKDQVGGAQQDINRAIEGVEFELASAIQQLTITERKRVGFTAGHEELDSLQDLVSLRYPVVTGQVNGKPQITPIEWPYFPLVNQYAVHPVTRNLDATMLRFAGSLDSVKAVGVKKTPLLYSSSYSRKVNAPLKINVNDLRKEITPQNFSTAHIPVAYLLEGTFRSLFENRFLPDGVNESGRKNLSPSTRVVVVADGDIGRNDINRRTGQPIELGFDAVTNHTFANRELILNLVAYLTDDAGLITTRTKEIRVRPLDKEKVRESRTYWQLVNLVAPLLLLLAIGAAKTYVRHRRYGRFHLVNQPNESASQ